MVIESGSVFIKHASFSYNYFFFVPFFFLSDVWIFCLNLVFILHNLFLVFFCHFSEFLKNIKKNSRKKLIGIMRRKKQRYLFFHKLFFFRSLLTFYRLRTVLLIEKREYSSILYMKNFSSLCWIFKWFRCYCCCFCSNKWITHLGVFSIE